MESLNPMFSKNNLQNTKITKVPKPNNEPVQRKKRSDAKHDVKIALSTEQRQITKMLAKRHHLSPTTYCSQLLGLFLIKNTDFQPVEYSPTDKRSVHANLSAAEYKLLFDYSVKWDCSIRQAAHRILTIAIKVESGGINIEEL
ncbi:MAG: hypothetical protein Q8934_23580 [Bacillota bacterium]|nr:hypothetical protein [Bacillota bacterium]